MAIVRCLLRARTDYITIRNVEWSLPSPDPGWTKCVDCRVNTRTAKICLVCNGSGYKRKRGDEVEFDRYSGQATSSLTETRGTSSPRQRDMERDEDETDRLLRQREARNPSGSLDSLERALQLLSERGRQVLQLVYASGLVSLKDPVVARSEARAVEQLARSIPGRLKPPPWDWPEIQQLRVSKIRQLEGQLSVSGIAKAVGCSRQLVRKILKEQVV